jgi:hypothetical protein
MNKHRISKCSLGVLSALAVSLAIWVPEGRAQLKPTWPTNHMNWYACAAGTGTLHDVSDLKGGVLPKHQTGGDAKYTCLAASKPAGATGQYTCPGGPGDLHLVSDLKGGVLAEHQVGNPARTCIAAALPICAQGYLPSKVSPGSSMLTPGDVCVALPPK